MRKKKPLPEAPEFAYVTPNDVERLFNIRAYTIRLWVAQGIFPRPFKFRNRLYWRLAELEEWFKELEKMNRIEPHQSSSTVKQIEGVVA